MQGNSEVHEIRGVERRTRMNIAEIVAPVLDEALRQPCDQQCLVWKQRCDSLHDKGCIDPHIRSESIGDRRK